MGPVSSGWRLPQLCDDPKVPAHLAVQHHHVLRVSTEPCLHGFADGTQFVQRRGMQLRPAKVLHLGKYREQLCVCRDRNKEVRGG